MISITKSCTPFLILLVSAAAAAGCGQNPDQDRGAIDSLDTPEIQIGSYLGDLPCADCEGIRTRIDLFEDKVFFLHELYLGRGNDNEYDDIGTWSVSEDGRTLSLQGYRGAPLLFQVNSDATIRKLDIEGLDITSELNYELVRQAGLDPLEPMLVMRGMYRYMADAAWFVECRTGRRLAVAFEADSISLERAYLEERESPGEEQLVNLEGRIAQRPAMEGNGTVTSLIVDRFIAVHPGETCDGRSEGRVQDSSERVSPGN